MKGWDFEHLHAYDHVLGANPERPGGWNGPYTHQHPFFEPFVLFSYLAGLTHKIEFDTGILILPQRQTALVAKQAATLDVLSGGRTRLGVGNGWNAVEYTALDEDFHNRGRRMEEQVRAAAPVVDPTAGELRGSLASHSRCRHQSFACPAPHPHLVRWHR